MSLAYGIQPFWFWNGEMKEQEIIRQIEDMHKQNISGFIIHPRQGMTIPYLSHVYFNRVRLAVETAKIYGMEVWLYDEYPYPSGVSGGEVLALHPEFQCKELKMSDQMIDGNCLVERDMDWGTLLFAKAYPMYGEETDWEQGIDLTNFIGVAYQQEIFQFSGLTQYNKKRFFTGGQTLRLHWESPVGKYRILVIVEAVMKDFKYFGSYIDTMNPKAIKCYLETTHEVYKREMGDEFGKTIKGIFTDEITAFPPEQPWSPGLPDIIKEISGLDILPWLPVVMGVDMGLMTQQVRYAYWNGAATAFMESYDKPVYQWCEENNLMLIGEKPIMRAEELQYFHIPGFEVGHQKVGDKPNLVPGKYRANGKLAASAAHFYNKPGALCEAFHSIGWDMTLQDMKWTLDWISQQGINWFIVHAFFYTTDGLQKHDAPPSAFFQMPWWEHMHQVTKHAEKIKEIQECKRPIQLLMLDPIASIWTECGERKDRLKEDFHRVQMNMLEHQLDYYIIDPQLLKTALIKKRQKTTVAVVHGDEYKGIVLSPMCMLEPECALWMENYARNGGIVYFVGAIPYADTCGCKLWTNEIFGENLERLYLQYQNGIESLSRKQDNLFFFSNSEQLIQSLWIMESRYQIVPKDAEGIERFLSTEYVNGDGKTCYFMTNLSTKTRKLQFRRKEQLVDMSFSPLESRWMKAEELDSVDYEGKKLTLSIHKKVKLSYNRPNALRLYYWNISDTYGQSFYTESMPIIEQLEKGGASLAVQTKKNFGCVKELTMPEGDYCYQTTFQWEKKLTGTGAVNLVMEPGTISGEWDMIFNGLRITKGDFVEQEVYSRTNVSCDISSMIQAGANELVVRVNVKEPFDGVRNPVYLFGDFGVEILQDHLIVTELPQKGCIKDPLKNKTPFYAGKIYGDIDVKAVGNEEYLMFSDIDLQDALEIIVNGHSIGTCCYAPYRYLLPKRILKAGRNHIRMVMSTTLIGLFEGQYFDGDSHAYINYQGDELPVEDYATILYK